jgi:hypothetical protein
MSARGGHHDTEPSAWVARWATLIRPGGAVLDVACGAGRHSRLLAAMGLTNYLHRPLLPVVVDSLEPGGILLYETFAQGNERFGKPSNPAFLLAPGELLDAVRGRLRVIAYEDLVVDIPRPAAVQRICARA